jgi:hypothetical protein
MQCPQCNGPAKEMFVGTPPAHPTPEQEAPYYFDGCGINHTRGTEWGCTSCRVRWTILPPFDAEAEGKLLGTFLKPLVDAGWEVLDPLLDTPSSEFGPSVARDLTRGRVVIEVEYLLDYNALDVFGDMAKHLGKGWQDPPGLGPESAEHVSKVNSLTRAELDAQYARIGLLP